MRISYPARTALVRRKKGPNRVDSGQAQGLRTDVRDSVSLTLTLKRPDLLRIEWDSGRDFSGRSRGWQFTLPVEEGCEACWLALIQPDRPHRSGQWVPNRWHLRLLTIYRRFGRSQAAGPRVRRTATGLENR